MKRSEMVEIIEMAINISRGQYNTHQLSQRIVEVIEAAGMTPPTYEEDCCPDQFKGTELEGCYTAFIPEWENEDE